MKTRYEKAQMRVTEKNPCGLTLRQRLKSWFWGTRVGVALNALLGRTTVYRAQVEGTLIVGDNALVVVCKLTQSASSDVKNYVEMYRSKISNG